MYTHAYERPCTHVKDSMSKFGGLWKHENNQHTLVPPKTECGCRSGRGIKNGHIRYPSCGVTQKTKIPKNLQFRQSAPRHQYVLENQELYGNSGSGSNPVSSSVHGMEAMTVCHWGTFLFQAASLAEVTYLVSLARLIPGAPRFSGDKGLAPSQR